MAARKRPAGGLNTPEVGTVVERTLYLHQGGLVDRVPPGQSALVWVAAGHEVTTAHHRALEQRTAAEDEDASVIVV